MNEGSLYQSCSFLLSDVNILVITDKIEKYYSFLLDVC
jgi:hypothetical protein